MIDYNIWHYDNLVMFRERLYNNGITEEHLTNEEIGVHPKGQQYPDFYFIAKIDRSKYLVPSFLVENNNLPILVTKKVKINVKGKAYYKIIEYDTLRIKAEQLMSYREMINSFMNIEHQKMALFTIFKIINDCAFDERINIEIITYPGWLKTSLMVCYNELLGYSYCIDKPSYAKLKLFLKDSTKVIGLDEINKINDDDAMDIASYIEATGDFRPRWINPKRAVEGVKEGCSLFNISNEMFYNFPKSDDEEPKKSLRYFHPILGHPKINRRLFSLLFEGGSEDDPAVKSKMIKPKDFDDEKFNFLMKWVKTKLFYSDSKNRIKILKQKGFKKVLKLKNHTWDTNFDTICDHLMLYAKDQKEYEQMEQLVYNAHKSYWKYIFNLKEGEKTIFEKVNFEGDKHDR